MYYTIVNGKLILQEDGYSYVVSHPAIMYDAQEKCLLKHGEAKDVEECFVKYIKKMGWAIPNITNVIRMLVLDVSPERAADFLNKAISTTGVIDKQINELKKVKRVL